MFLLALFHHLKEIPMAECGVLTDAAMENSTLLEFSLAANEATPEMLYRRRDPKVLQTRLSQ